MSDLKADFDKLVEEVRAELEKHKRKLAVRPFASNPKRGYSLWAQMHFAWVILRRRDDCLGIGTEEKWTNKAGVKADWYSDISAWGRRGAHWRVHEDDIDKRQEVARYLARICEARHSD